MKNICFQMSRKVWLVAVVALVGAFPALAQNITVSGTVYEPDGETAIGVSIMLQGVSGVGVTTDIDGNYRLQNVPADGTLVVSYVGYETQEIAIDGRTHIDITLSTQSKALEELVVIGYGTVKKEDATGSVSVIKPDDIEAGLSVSTQDLLVGASPGVVVTTSGNPTGNGTIRIRGGSSLSASNDPLIVVDGVPMNDQSNAGGTNALSMINPQNIESMTILKDASATAIYGSRASNGVIIITTKKGKAGKPQVNFAANFHVNTARKTFDMMDASEISKIVRATEKDAAIALLGNANTNWQKEVLRTTISEDLNLSIGGMAGILPYRASVGWTNNQGILKTSGMQRTNVNFNLSPKFFNGLLQVNANVAGTYIKSREADQGAIGAAIGFNPTQPVYFPYETRGTTKFDIYNGFYNVTLANGGPENQASENPLQMLLDKNNTGQVWSSSGNLQVDYALHFLPELHLNLNLGYQVSKNTSKTIVNRNSIMAWRDKDLLNFGSAGAGSHSEWYELQRNTMLEFYANYKKDFEALRSTVDLMAGYSWQRMTYLGHSQRYVDTMGFVTDNGYIPFKDGVYTLDSSGASAVNIGKPVQNAPMSYWSGPNQLVSFYGRLNYSFDNTYLLTFTLRDDATSRFSKDNRWGLFPALALGWKIINMPFMENAQRVVNDLKLRLGWGITGQQNIGGLFPYMPIYTWSDKQGFQYISPDGQWINPLYPQPYAPNIKWEETTTWNVGVDMAFLNNRITAALDWYLRDTKDLLAKTPVAGVNTSNYLTRNIGSLRNTGVEATVTARPVVTRDFTWNTSVNVAWNKNKITKLTGDAETSQIPARSIPSGTGGDIQFHLVGQPAFTYLVYQQVYDVDGNPVPNTFVDQNADGVIDDQDKIMFHSPEPKVTVSWNNTINYKNWDFGISMRANFGNWVYNAPKYEYTRVDNVYHYQINNLMNNAFLFNTTSEENCLSDYFVENASFIRCDNITVGYTVPDFGLRVYGAVQNPFVITKYKGLDPEVFDGIDNNVYPRPITFTLGLVQTF